MDISRFRAKLGGLNQLGILLLKILSGLVIGIVVLLLCAMAVLRFVLGPVPDCGSNSPAVAKARALSQEELATLYDAMSLQMSAGKAGFRIWTAHEGLDGLPSVITKLEPVVVHVTERPRITLAGCLDHYVILYFWGLSDQDSALSEPGIELQWGEASDSGSEVLWQP